MTLKSSARPLASAVVYKKESVSKMDTQKRGIVMGFRFRKSVNLGGVRFTASKSGVSTSVGGKGFRVTKHANGKVSSTASIPGTGISYTSNLSSSKSFNSEEPEDYHGYSQYTDNSDFPEEDDRPAFLPKEVIDSLNLDAFLAYSENFLSWAKKLGTNGYYVTPEEFEEVRKIIRYINESTEARKDPNFEKNRRAAQKLAAKEKAKEIAQQQAAQKLAEKEKAKELTQQQAAQKLAEKERLSQVATLQTALQNNKVTAKQKVGVLPVLCSIFFFFCMLLSGTFQHPHIALIAFLICFILTLPIRFLFDLWERIKLPKEWRVGLICIVFFWGSYLASPTFL